MLKSLKHPLVNLRMGFLSISIKCLYFISVKTPTQKPSMAPKTYVIDNETHDEAPHHGSIAMLCIFFAVIIVLIVSLAYRRYGDRAAAWYMIRFSKRNCGDDGTPVATTLNGTTTAVTKKSETNMRTKPKKKSRGYSEDFTRPLVDDDDDADNDENYPINGNIVLKNHTYTEL